MDERDAPHAGVVPPSPPISPSEASHNCGEGVTDNWYDGEVPAMLPLHDFVLLQIANVSMSGLHTGLHKHPTDMSVEETALRVIGVKWGVGIAVMRSVSSSPPVHRALNSTRSHQAKEILQRSGSVI